MGRMKRGEGINRHARYFGSVPAASRLVNLRLVAALISRVASALSSIDQ
jgi:hypothetical protein